MPLVVANMDQLWQGLHYVGKTLRLIWRKTNTVNTRPLSHGGHSGLVHPQTLFIPLKFRIVTSQFGLNM